MLKENKPYSDFMGIPGFTAKGYTGKRVIAATDPFRYDLAIKQGHNIFYPEAATSITDHRTKAAWVGWDLGVDVTLIPAPIQNKVLDVVTDLYAKGVTVIFTSDYNGLGDYEAFDALMAKLPNLKVISSAGNDGEVNNWIHCKTVWGVGAYNLENGVPSIRSDSTPSAGVDFYGPSGVSVKPYSDVGSFTYIQTSCACPAIAVGIIVLLDDLAIAKTGKPLTRDGMYKLLKDISPSGILRLPDPDSIDLTKYTDAPLLVPVNYGDHSEWATDAVKYSVDNGIFQGDGDGNFRWYDNITRQEMAQTLFNFAKKLGGT